MSYTNEVPLSPRRSIPPSDPPNHSRARRGPDTAASGIDAEHLPRQQFFPEGSDGDEDFDEEDEGDDADVFAFSRPVTAAQPGGVKASGYGIAPAPVAARPNTGRPATGAVSWAPSPLEETHESTEHVGSSTGPGTISYGDVPTLPLQDTPRSVNPNPQKKDNVPTPTGVIDIGGHLPDTTYDKANPPPFSGRNNPNNSSFASFAFNMSNPPKARRPRTGQSLLDKIQRRRKPETGESSITTTTGLTGGAGEHDADGFSDIASLPGINEIVPHSARRRSSNTKSIMSGSSFVTESEVTSDDRHTRRSRQFSRGSIGLTEMTGDMTVPDGKTTWGDGYGGRKGEEVEGDSMADLDMDMVEEDSPYPEVRASVSNIDDPDMPAMTFRAWFLGILFTILASACNTYFHFRTPAPYISPLIVQVCAYPVGKFFAWCLPINDYALPRWLGGAEFSLNPGPFNIKEHTIIVMMANVAIGPAYALYATVSSELYYGHNWGIGFSIMFLLATQMTGFSLAGICRRFVVWPASMIWPANLVVATNLNTFHAEEDGFTGGMSRFKFLIICGSSAFIWYFFPGFIFTSLSYFSWVCWIAPNNNVVNELFGVSTGLGMGLLTFDWTQVTWIGSPLTTPWWASVNIGVGFVLFYWILTPILYYTNVWETAYLPISVTQAADRFGSTYDIYNILTEDITLNQTAYAEYSPVYLSASFCVTFMVAFALSTALIVHTALYHGPRIYRAIVNVKTEADDIHFKLMKMYPEVPDWWFLALFLVVFVLAVVSLEVYHTELPVWGYIISVLLPLVYIIPTAFIYAMTSQQVTINLLAELIPGFIFQGQPLPGMIFKVFSVQSIVEALSFIQDQKLGHYMKVPPRATFVAQLTATTVACFVQSGMKELLFHVVKDICTSTQKSLLTCASTKTFFTSSIIWGLIGPERLFSKGSSYYPQVFALVAGAILPIPLWFWVRKYPRSIFRNMNFPVMFSGSLAIPPASGINYSSWIVVGFVFQFWLRRRRFAWWSKYNYVLSAALDVGTALSAIALFLFLDLPGASLSWWGTKVHKNTADWDGTGAAYLTAPAEGFGPSTWKL
ncbi:OPT family small oligopeptide transporter [Cryptococcus amylolentus CBS 6273]|uniref:OPT family small oligopeptide transporter n=1 Tax=Cryptococcus amylolentus CBS 6273 TaxID=1296118 RepID=A0A1E3KGZ5_9TREE|nr:OPT family small oligopeptide transporter [Cryptococcus amylolentus CBS 6273]